MVRPAMPPALVVSLLNQGRDQATKPLGDRLYNADWVGGLTPSEIQDAVQGDYDESGQRRCAFCRVPKRLDFGDCCDAYCHKNQHGSIPTGRNHPFDNDQRGRERLTLG